MIPIQFVAGEVQKTGSGACLFRYEWSLFLKVAINLLICNL